MVCVGLKPPRAGRLLPRLLLASPWDAGPMGGMQQYMIIQTDGQRSGRFDAACTDADCGRLLKCYGTYTSPYSLRGGLACMCVLWIA